MTVKKKPDLDQTFINIVCERIQNNQRIHRLFQEDSVIHMDHQVPFLCIYRCKEKSKEKKIASFIRGEISFLIVNGKKSIVPFVRNLTDQTIASLTNLFGGFLLLELWEGELSDANQITDPTAVTPGFKIYVPEFDSEDYGSTHDTLQENLTYIRVHKQRATAEIVYLKKIVPPGLSLLLADSRRQTLNCHYIGLEVSPIYSNPINGDHYPLIVRQLHRGISHALRRTFFEFTRKHTSHRPKHYHALGRRAVTKYVWEIDRELTEISESFDFLLQVTPINTLSAWHAFKRNGFARAPVFHYRPHPVDPTFLKRRLYNIKIVKIEDPTLAALFREKRTELDRQISMLPDRGSANFLYGSLQLYEKVSNDLLQTAETILEKISGRSGNTGKSGYMSPDKFAKRAEEEFELYRQQDSNFSAKVEVTSKVTGLIVSQGNLYIGPDTKIPVKRAEALIQHEVGTHILTYYNGKQQRFQLLACGLSGYEEFQEGLAVLSEYLAGSLSRPRLRLLAGRVVAAHYLEQGATFIETFRRLDRNHDFSQRIAYDITMRIYRGGGLTKDAIYLRGLINIIKYIREGGDIRLLLVGKISSRHVPIIEELQLRGIIIPPKINPSYLELPETSERLTQLAQKQPALEFVDMII